MNPVNAVPVQRPQVLQPGFHRPEAHAGGHLAQVLDARQAVAAILHRHAQPDVGWDRAVREERGQPLGTFGQQQIGVPGRLADRRQRPLDKGVGHALVEQVRHPDILKRVLAHAKAPLKDAAAVNATRWALANRLKARWPTALGSGGRTKFNRTRQGYAKDHWIDAACVGESGERVTIRAGFKPLGIVAKGRGTRQVVRTDKYGFPRGKAGRIKRVFGFSTGDRVRLVQPSGKYAGVHVGRLAGIRATGQLDIATAKITASYKNFTLIQRGDGYDYAA